MVSDRPSPHVGHDDVEVVQPGGFGAAPQVVPLLQALRVVRDEEELDGEAERILGSDRLPHPGRDARGQAGRPGAERGVERLGPVQVGRGADPEREPGGGGFTAFAQDQVVVGQLVVAAQVEGADLGTGDHEAEQVDPEPARPLQVGDDQFGVGGPDDVGRHHGQAPKRGTRVSARGTWTIRDSV
jgi:hypothetical protein